MSGYSIRRLTLAEIDRNDEQEREAYEAAEDAVLAELRAEWEAEFGTSEKFWFEPDMKKVHALAQARIDEAKQQ